MRRRSFSLNVRAAYRPFGRTDQAKRSAGRVIRLSILLLGAAAALLALRVQSVQALWFFTSAVS